MEQAGGPETQLLTLQAGATRYAAAAQLPASCNCAAFTKPHVFQLDNITFLTSYQLRMRHRDESKSSKKKSKKPKADAYLQAVPDRKLKGQLKHTERLYKEANQVAARVNTWLAPADAGFLETEGETLVYYSSTDNCASDSRSTAGAAQCWCCRAYLLHAWCAYQRCQPVTLQPHVARKSCQSAVHV
jgi:hypothetical protein